jgi:CTP synthase
MESGITADVLVCRTEPEISDDIKNKLALFCNVEVDSVIQSIDASTIYEVPLLMKKEKLDQVVLKKLDLVSSNDANLERWSDFVNRLKFPKNNIKIGLIGKYVELQDSYKSILESLIHAGSENETKVEVVSIHSEHINESNVKEKFEGLHGILVAPGFGERGIEGKIDAVKYARENNLPYLGICLGMQMAVIEFSRNILGLKNANSTEMNPETSFPVIDLMDAQKNITDKGGTMRLGSWKCNLIKESIAGETYDHITIEERHRHRYEYNNEYRIQLEAAGLKTSGINPDTGLVEIIEIENHPWFVGVQYHPEYKSTVANPHPLFVSFVKAANEHLKKNHTTI